MLRNPKECPYLLEKSRQLIKCKGIADGCIMQQGYSSPNAARLYFSEYCCKNYHLCGLAATINTVQHEYEVLVCPNNSEVECLHNDECDHCGWNPTVSQQRLRRLYKL